MHLPRTREEALGAVEAELRSEKASALGRVGKRIDAALDRLRQLEEELQAAPPAARPALIEQHRAARKDAERLVWYLVVQREALGLYQHGVVAEKYPIPPAIRQ